MHKLANFKEQVHPRGNRGVALTVVVIIVAVVVLIASIGIFYFVVGNTSTTGLPNLGVTSNFGSRNLYSSSSHLSSASSIGARTVSFSSPTASGASGMRTYHGTFSYSLPLGPTGERVLGNNTVQQYRSVQLASGTFTFSIAALNRSGTGSGQGVLTVTTSGFCSGVTTFPYTLKIIDATTLLSGNLTMFIGDPTPANFTVPLTRTGPMAGGNTSVNNPSSFLSVYPNEISTANVPVTLTQHLSGNITYSYSIA
ncbi:MAG TPA: hypothetical protein VFF30_17970 [Nitrososphaerales archaeon]|nr:hypothetical protein [Nitrososphaerales archaeon]